VIDDVRSEVNSASNGVLRCWGLATSPALLYNQTQNNQCGGHWGSLRRIIQRTSQNMRPKRGAALAIRGQKPLEKQRRPTAVSICISKQLLTIPAHLRENLPYIVVMY